MKKTIVIISGGMDSAVLLTHLAKTEGKENIRALSLDYGQRHRRELACAAAQAIALGVEWKLGDLKGITSLLAGSSQTDPSIQVPEGRYDEESMKLTVVPNRNMILLAVAAAWAISTKSQAIAYAAHGGDHAIYPDCREDFCQAMGRVLGLCDWQEIELARPFVHLTKADLVTMGLGLGVDFGATWSCYRGDDLACGRCGTCTERLEAFSLAKADDPLRYQDREFWKTVSGAGK